MRDQIKDILWPLTKPDNINTVNAVTDALMELIEEEKKTATCEAIEKIANGLANARASR